MSFEEFTKRIQDHFDFKISFQTPYRLCNFKPAYGDIFSEYIKMHDFWGYCDNDLIWGDIRSFLPDDVLNNYNRIGCLGHFSLIRNTEEFNNFYKFKDAYKLAFSEDYDLLFFDEHAFNDIFKIKNERIYKLSSIADFNPRKYNFQLNPGCSLMENMNSHHIYKWNNGNLVRLYLSNGKIKKEKVMYIHFLKRPMHLVEPFNINTSSYFIVPNKFYNGIIEITVDEIIAHSKNQTNIAYWLKVIKTIFKKVKYKIVTEPQRKKIFMEIYRIIHS